MLHCALHKELCLRRVSLTLVNSFGIQWQGYVQVSLNDEHRQEVT